MCLYKVPCPYVLQGNESGASWCSFGSLQHQITSGMMQIIARQETVHFKVHKIRHMIYYRKDIVTYGYIGAYTRFFL